MPHLVSPVSYYKSDKKVNFLRFYMSNYITYNRLYKLHFLHLYLFFYFPVCQN